MASQATILLADDNEDDVLLMQRALRKALVPNPVLVLTDGTQVIKYLKGEEPFTDPWQYPLPILLLLDLKMRRMSGFEVLQWIRQEPKLKRLWVIMLTHSRETSDVNRAYELGANSYLVKPARLESLIRVVEQLQNFWLSLSERPDCER